MNKSYLIIALLSLMFFFSAFPLCAKDFFSNERHVYTRGEEVSIEFQSSAKAVIFNVDNLLQKQIRVAEGIVHFSIDTRFLRSGNYTISAKPIYDGKDAEGTVFFPISIVPEPNSQRYPVWHWGEMTSDEIGYWVERGFNGFRRSGVSTPSGMTDQSIQQTINLLEEGARVGADIGLYFNPLRWPGWKKQKAASSILPKGCQNSKKIYPLEPQVIEHSKKTVQNWMKRFSKYPSFRHVLLSSEYTAPFCLNESMIALAKHELDIDLEASLVNGFIPSDLEWPSIKKMPAVVAPEEGIIDNNNPMYRILMWWWQSGNGLAKLNAIMADQIHNVRNNILVWHDPYRSAPVYGTHKGLDAISTWTYGHPDIKRLCYTRALQAAALPNLKVMQTITLYVYDRFVMPPDLNSLANLLLDSPNGAKFFTHCPDYAREALWLVFSQRPDIISMYYSGKLNPKRSKQSSTITSPETFDAIGDINRTLIQPYGPAILQGKPRKAKVAVLMSASAIWFRENERWYGYPNESILPFCILLMMNHIPFDVLLDDDIQNDRLVNYDLLVIPYGDAMTRSVHDHIVKFAKVGKIVIADETLRANIPGVHYVDMNFSFMRRVDGNALLKRNALTADDYQKRMEDYADQLAPELSNLDRPFRCKSKRVLINEVISGDVRYMFVINDSKTYGPRFGKWKLLQELGVEQLAEVDVVSNVKPVIYDALNRIPLQYQWMENIARFDVLLPPAQGKLLAILPQAIHHIKAIMPKTVKRGNRCAIRLMVVDLSGNSINGSIPLRINFMDSFGNSTEYSRYAATVFSDKYNWSYGLDFFPALNDSSGEWTIQVSELLSGKSSDFRILVK